MNLNQEQPQTLSREIIAFGFMKTAIGAHASLESIDYAELAEDAVTATDCLLDALAKKV